MMGAASHDALCVCRYYDVAEGNGALAREGERVVVHYEARWKGVTFMTSRCCIIWAPSSTCSPGDAVHCGADGH